MKSKLSHHYDVGLTHAIACVAVSAAMCNVLGKRHRRRWRERVDVRATQRHAQGRSPTCEACRFVLESGAQRCRPLSLLACFSFAGCGRIRLQLIRHDGGEKAIMDEEGGTASMKAKETPIPPVNTSGTLLSSGVTMVPVPDSPGGPCIGSNFGFIVCSCLKPALSRWCSAIVCGYG